MSFSTRAAEPARTNSGASLSYGQTTGRREHAASSGGAENAGAQAGGSAGWYVVDARSRGGRSWDKLFKQLSRLLDDIYLTCELDCSLPHVQAVVEYLQVSVEDFTQLHSQLESVVAPSGQKVAWEVRASRSSRSNLSLSPRLGATGVLTRRQASGGSGTTLSGGWRLGTGVGGGAGGGGAGVGAGGAGVGAGLGAAGAAAPAAAGSSPPASASAWLVAARGKWPGGEAGGGAGGAGASAAGQAGAMPAAPALPPRAQPEAQHHSQHQHHMHHHHHHHHHHHARPGSSSYAEAAAGRPPHTLGAHGEEGGHRLSGGGEAAAGRPPAAQGAHGAGLGSHGAEVGHRLSGGGEVAAAWRAGVGEGPGPPVGPTAAAPAGGAVSGQHGPTNPWSARKVDWSSVLTQQQQQQQQQHRAPSSTQQQQPHGQPAHALRQAPGERRQRGSSGGSSAAGGSSWGRGGGGGGGGGSPSGSMTALLPPAPALNPPAGALNPHPRTLNLDPQQHTHIPGDPHSHHHPQHHAHPLPDPRAYPESHHDRHFQPPGHQQLRLGSGGFRYGSAPPPPRLDTTITSGDSSRRSSSGSCSDSGACDSGGRAWGGRGGALSAGLRPGRPLSGTVSPLGAAYDSLYPKILTSPVRHKLSPAEVRRASEERQARAERARQALVEERLARLAAANQSRQTAKTVVEERAGAIAARVEGRIARSAELRQAHLAGRVQKAVEETKKVAEVAFINQMLEQDKKLALQEKLEEGEVRRRQALEALQQRSKGAAAAVEEAQERRKQIEAERLELLADRQRRKMAAQAKLEEERRAAAAAREAAKEAQRAAAVQAAAARQQLRDVLSVRIEERLREAAARRAHQRELIKERAALGKDIAERRATLDGLPTSSPRSPQARVPRPPSPSPSHAALLAPDLTAAAAGGGRGGLRLTASHGSLSGNEQHLHPPGHQPHHTRSGSGTGMSPAPFLVAAAAAAASGGAGSPLRSTDRSVTLALTVKNRLKGMRRRAAKTLTRMETARLTYTEPPYLEALLSSPDGKDLVAAWTDLVSSCHQATDAAAAAAAAAADRARGGKAKAGGKAGASKGGSCAGGGGGGADAAAAAATAVKHLLQRVHTDLGGRSKTVALHAARPSGLLRALAALLTEAAAAATPHPAQASVQMMELLALLVTASPHSAAWLLACGGPGPLCGLVRCAMRALDRYNGLAADELWQEPPEARYLSALLQTLACLCRTALPPQPEPAALAALQQQQEDLVEYIVACGLVHRSTELFSLFDQPAANDTAPIPGYVLQCLALLEAVTGGPRRRFPAAALSSARRWTPPAPNAAGIALAFQETSMGGLPSLLTAVLLRAAPSCTPAEARPERLPPNFVEVAACVLRVLNNVARLDLVAAQTALSAPDLRVVLLHLTSFLLSYCINQWPAAGLAAAEPAIHAALAAAAAPAASACAVPVATVTRTPGGSSGGGAAAAGGGRPAAGSNGGGAGPAAAAAASAAAAGLVTLLNEVLLLAGLYVLLQPANQDVLLWGRSPTILQLLAEVPFAYLVEPQLYQVLMPSLVSVCYGSERVCATLSQHMDLHLLRDYVQTMLVQQQQQQQPQTTSSLATAPQDAPHSTASTTNTTSPGARSSLVAPLPPPTAERYSLQQRFPLELLPRALAFLDSQLQLPGDRGAANTVLGAMAAAGPGAGVQQDPAAAVLGSGSAGVLEGGAGAADGRLEANGRRASGEAGARVWKAAARLATAPGVVDATSGLGAAAGLVPLGVVQGAGAARAAGNVGQPCSGLASRAGSMTAPAAVPAALLAAARQGAGAGAAASGPIAAPAPTVAVATATAVISAGSPGAGTEAGGSSSNFCARSYRSELSFGGYLSAGGSTSLSVLCGSLDGDGVFDPGEFLGEGDEAGRDGVGGSGRGRGGGSGAEQQQRQQLLLDLDEQYERDLDEQQRELDEQQRHDVLLLDEQAMMAAAAVAMAAGQGGEAGLGMGAGKGPGRRSSGGRAPDFGESLRATAGAAGREVRYKTRWMEYGDEYGGLSTEDEADDAEGMLGEQTPPAVSPETSLLVLSDV